MTTYSQFDVKVLLGNQEISLNGEVSYIGDDLGGQLLKVLVKPLPGRAKVHPFVVGYSWSIHPLPNVTSDIRNPLYHHYIIPKGKTIPRYPRNALRVLEILYGGDILVWELALVKQGESYFFTVQKNYETSCYEGIVDGSVYCPFFEEWPAMRDFLEELLRNEACFLKPFIVCVDSYQYPQFPMHGNLTIGRGEVKWYNLAQGMGCITVREPRSRNIVEARVCWNHINTPDQFKYLERGRRVHCGIVRRVHYPRSRFYWQILDVQP